MGGHVSALLIPWKTWRKENNTTLTSPAQPLRRTSHILENTTVYVLIREKNTILYLTKSDVLDAHNKWLKYLYA